MQTLSPYVLDIIYVRQWGLLLETAKINALVDTEKGVDDFDVFSEMSEEEVSCSICMAQKSKEKDGSFT